MTLSAQLLEILACPEDKGPLLYFEGESTLYNPRLKQTYRIDGSIPVMLVDEATKVDETEHSRLVELAAELNIEPTFTS